MTQTLNHLFNSPRKQRKAYILFFILALSSMIASCTSDRGIHNTKLRDRVTACSAGFSEGAQGSLTASLEKKTIKAASSADFKNETKAIIFSEVPSQDRLKAYEDYIRCIEQK